ncbi:MAG: aldo/keto reductase [Verrucomicrobium sp.]|nr:aldo/keto reductase [Verrucomicrobium sp.]
MEYALCGRSGLRLPRISLGLWQNFGRHHPFENGRAMLRRAFELGVTHFDLANNYGPPPGAAEEAFGRILKLDFAGRRDGMVIATKAGYRMWDGPYGDGGSRKYLLASLDQSLARLGLDYVDIFYSHRPDPETPLEETMGALDHAVRSGKALYAGISNYSPEQTAAASAILRRLGTPCLIHQPRYSLFSREPEAGLFSTLEEEGIGCIVFSPLAQGVLGGRYREGIPADSRIGHGSASLRRDDAQLAARVAIARKLEPLAARRGQSVAQLAVGWILRQKAVTSVLIGASQASQIEELCAVPEQPPLSPAELAEIEALAAPAAINF